MLSPEKRCDFSWVTSNGLVPEVVPGGPSDFLRTTAQDLDNVDLGNVGMIALSTYNAERPFIVCDDLGLE